MQIEIKNFGPIKYLKFDLSKDLHLIYGENAIGKSYATYCLYCLIKNIKNKAIGPRYVMYNGGHESMYGKFIKPKLSKLTTNKPHNLTKDFHKLVAVDLSSIVLEGLRNSFLNTFSSLKNLKNRYTNADYEIVLNISSSEKVIIFSGSTGLLDLRYEYELEKIEIIQKETVSTKYTLNINGKKVFGKPTEGEFISEFMRHSFVKTNEILDKLDFNIRDIYYLPASRSGLYQALNAFTPIIAELTQNRFFMQNKNIELPSLSEPLADYFIDLSTVNKKHLNKEYSSIIDSMQNDILRGSVEYDEKTKRILYKPSGIDLELNLSEASSMVAELSPLVLYFKHILNHKYAASKNRDSFYYPEFYEYQNRKPRSKVDVLFIEEPEAHLHPEVQVKLIEIFAKLSKLNLKIFITSHSNYMFNKLNNMIIKKEINKDKIKVYHLIRNADDSSTVDGDMKVTNEGINDENFQDVSQKLYYERLNFYESEENK